MSWLQLLVALAPTVVALLAYLQGRKNRSAIQEVHVSLNSRLTELLRQTSIAQRAEGKAEGLAESKVK